MIYEFKGLGDVQTTGTLINIGGNVAATAATAGIVATLGATSMLVPVVGPLIAGVTALISLFIGKNAQQKIATTHIVDEVEPYMKQNLAAWQQEPHTVTNQTAALANFDALWGQVTKACSSGDYGSAGERCISDRSHGGKWDWFAYYRDPIANAKDIVADNPVSSVASSLGLNPNGLNIDGTNIDWFWILAGLGLIILI